MKHLIDKEKFLAELKTVMQVEELHPSHIDRYVYIEDIEDKLSKHLKDIKDEPHHPSGMDNDKIKIRNALRRELRGE